MAFENLTDGKSNSFVEAAVWADDIKEYKANYFDDYHFTDMYKQFYLVFMILISCSSECRNFRRM